MTDLPTLSYRSQTGMPIKAASDKIIREIEMFGPEFDQGAAASDAVSPLHTDRYD